MATTDLVDTTAQDRNKEAARRLYEEVVTLGALDQLQDLIAPDATGFSAGSTLGPDGFTEHVAALRSGLSDVRASVFDLVAEGDRVVVYWRIEGRHTGVVWGIPASGNRVDGESVSLIRFRDGKVVDYSVRPDRLTVLQQLGALPHVDRS